MMDREDLDREDFRKNLTNLFVQFADWPCKAKFKYITANRFVESSELEDSLKSKHDSHTNYLVTSIKLSHTDDNGHILINFKFDEKGKTDEEINIAYSNFLGFIIMTFYVIEDEFFQAKIEIPEIKIILFNTFMKELKQLNKNEFIEFMKDISSNKKIIL